MQTYIRRFNLNPKASPYVQGLLEADGLIHMEISGNVSVKPPLTELEMDTLEFYGWEKPEVSEGSYREHHKGIPNFYRLFENGTSKTEIAEAIFTALVGVFGMTDKDFLGFGGQSQTVSKLGLLGRLKVTDSNPFGDIFALPGQHLDMLERSKRSNGGK